MPWVLSQYTEPSIDLADPRNYRDLSKPIGTVHQAWLCKLINYYSELLGALNERRLQDFLERSQV